KTTTWREFICPHMDMLVATNFFTSEVWTWWGLVIFALSSLCPFGRWPLHLTGWRVAVARWIHAVLKQGVSLLLQRGERVRSPVFSAGATHASQAHFPQSRGTVVLLPVVNYGQIRDGPLRRQQRLGGLLMDANREAARGVTGLAQEKEPHA